MSSASERHRHRRREHWLIALAFLGAVVAPARAQSMEAASDYPSRPIHVIVDFPAGGLSDILARAIGQKLFETFGQPVVVEPRPGAGGVLAYSLVAKSAADGYTLGFISTPFAVNLNLLDKLPYDTLKDFTLVSLVATAPNVLVANPSVPAKNVPELIAYAKTRTGGLNFASTGVGSSAHLSGEQLKTAARIEATHVPYNGSGPALADLVAGRVDFMFVPYPAALPQVKAGKLTLLATGGPSRLAAFPEVPTIAESAFAGFRSIGWYGIAVPSGTPQAAVGKLNAEIRRALAQEDVRQQFANLGVEAGATSPEEFRAFVNDEIERWGIVSKNSGAKRRN